MQNGLTAKFWIVNGTILLQIPETTQYLETEIRKLINLLEIFPVSMKTESSLESTCLCACAQRCTDERLQQKGNFASSPKELFPPLEASLKNVSTWPLHFFILFYLKSWFQLILVGIKHALSCTYMHMWLFFSAENEKSSIEAQNQPLKFRQSVSWSPFQITQPTVIVQDGPIWFVCGNQMPLVLLSVQLRLQTHPKPLAAFSVWLPRDAWSNPGQDKPSSASTFPENICFRWWQYMHVPCQDFHNNIQKARHQEQQFLKYCNDWEVQLQFQRKPCNPFSKYPC